jgi:hypothetical protein
MVNPFYKFTINSVARRLNKINTEISLSHQVPFPDRVLLSRYRFKKRFVGILPNGDIRGGLVKMIISLVDFSFVRSMVAHCYAPTGPPCYDPPSLLLLDLFRYIDGYPNMSAFVQVLRDGRGQAYRAYAGICGDVPCEATFSNFRARIGEQLYNEIFHVLVDIFHRLEMISFNILAHDGTLYHTWARYKGCTWFCDQCRQIVVDDVLEIVRGRILYRLNKLDQGNLGSEIRVTTECPSDCFPEEVKKPKIELFACRLAFADGELSRERKNTTILFGVQKELEKHGLCIHTLRSNVTSINFCDGSMTICCPKLPKDTDARIGVRRDPRNPNKKQKIFGYNAVLTTSVELHLKIELPVAVSNIAGNAEEGSLIIVNDDQITAHHRCRVKVDIADAKYDITENYDYIRKKGSIPIIDYNRRRENLSRQALLGRGYDEKGWPFAPCGLLCRPNGFDKKRQRLTFCCFKQCADLRRPALKRICEKFDVSGCPHAKNRAGFTTHMSVKEHPRLVNEIPRGSKRYNEIKKLRSASERANSTLKDDLGILEKPRVMNGFRSNILSQIATIVLLLTRAFGFIARITFLFRKLRDTDDPKVRRKVSPPVITKSILNIIQRE